MSATNSTGEVQVVLARSIYLLGSVGNASRKWSVAERFGRQYLREQLMSGYREAHAGLLVPSKRSGDGPQAEKTLCVCQVAHLDCKPLFYQCHASMRICAAVLFVVTVLIHMVCAECPPGGEPNPLDVGVITVFSMEGFNKLAEGEIPTLELTDSGTVLGMLLLSSSLPRGLLMLYGGSLVDRLPDIKWAVLGASVFKGSVVIALSLLILFGTVEIWQLVIISVLFGVTDALYFPAHMAMIPLIMSNGNAPGAKPETETKGETETETEGEGERERDSGRKDYSQYLQAANAAASLATRSSLFTGPLLGGAVISLFPSDMVDPDTGEVVPTMTGIGWAMLIDALTFVFHVGSLLFVHIHKPETQTETEAKDDDKETEGEGEADAEAPSKPSTFAGLALIAKSKTMLLVFLVMSLQTFMFCGPFFIGVPFRIKSELGGTALDYGRVVSSYGLTTMAGGLFSMVSGTKLRDASVVLLVFCVAFVYGIGLFVMGIADSTVYMAIMIGIMGFLDGVANPMVMTFFQSMAPPGAMGQVMGALMTCWVALEPVSYAVTGFAFELGADTIMMAAGLMLGAMFVVSIALGYGLGWVKRDMEGDKSEGETTATPDDSIV
ncbi:major facilitator superfamily protein [Kipferlia bialata]|uniref:Major facilitator superfamily protein n=1 Tax=Kipferlia bialata TaxID=797122 RepID=A0A9K3CRM6_9EUKA|nr:major facilitator superfamily protein [Kipferlia bialata]|eukprot:g1986.t1